MRTVTLIYVGSLWLVQFFCLRYAKFMVTIWRYHQTLPLFFPLYCTVSGSRYLFSLANSSPDDRVLSPRSPRQWKIYMYSLLRILTLEGKL